MMKYILYLLLSLFFCSCSRYSVMQSRATWVEPYKFNGKEEIVLGNYIICHSQMKKAMHPKVELLSINEDSVFRILNTSLKANGFQNIAMTEGENFCDSAIHSIVWEKYISKYKYAFDSAANVSLDGLILVPYLSIKKMVEYGGFVTSGGAGRGDFLHTSVIGLTIFIYKGPNVVYMRRVVFSNTPKHDARSWSEAFAIPTGIGITQENWNELVRRAMKGYLKQTGQWKR